MFFDKVQPAPIDPVFGLDAIFQKDPRSHKIYLCVGFYQNDQGQARLMESIQKAKQITCSKENLAKYLPSSGEEGFLHDYTKLVLGDQFFEQNSSKICTSQTPGGTGALRVGGEFFFRNGISTIFLPKPTWGNHKLIFEKAGLKVEFYDYYDDSKHFVDFEKMYNSIGNIPENSCVLLQASCHNPSGADLQEDQWVEISKIFLKRKLLPFFDLAYQGIGKGLVEDVFSLRLFAKEGLEFFIAATCSKNFSLYCQRVGALIGIFPNENMRKNVFSQVNRTIRGIYSNPPMHGACLVKEILSNSMLKKLWEKELAEMRLRLKKNRELLCAALASKSHDFDFIKKHNGMFSLLGLTPDQVGRLREEFAVYILSNSRINFAGLNPSNVEYVAQSISMVMR